MGAVSFVRFLFAVLLSFLAAFLVLGVLAFVAMRIAQPQSVLAPFTAAAMLIGAWFCGLFGSGVDASHPKVWGMLCYAGYLLLILLISFAFSGQEISWVSRLISVLVGGAVAFFGSCFHRRSERKKNAHASIRRAKKKIHRKA